MGKPSVENPWFESVGRNFGRTRFRTPQTRGLKRWSNAFPTLSVNGVSTPVLVPVSGHSNLTGHLTG